MTILKQRRETEEVDVERVRAESPQERLVVLRPDGSRLIYLPGQAQPIISPPYVPRYAKAPGNGES